MVTAVRATPSPRPRRPTPYRYDFSHLLNFPRRLLFPPTTGVGSVRSFKITPIYDIALNDVLDGKHLPPLTLKDFEDYLVYEAHSAENLYFICWLRDYNKAYDKWQSEQAALPTEKQQEASPDLTISFARARGTFFDPSSHLELNLPGELVETLLSDTKYIPYASPTQLSEIQKHVEGMLRESLMKFVVGSCKNSGRRRGVFAIVVGLAAMLVGLAPVLMSILRGESRWVRLAALLPFWFGAMTAIAGFHGVCIVIFLFGDARQLYPYELARPTLCAVPATEPLSLPLPVAMHTKKDAGSGGSSSSFEEERKQASPAADGGIPMSPVDGAQPATGSSESDYVPETAGFIPSYEPSVSSHTASASMSGTPYKFDFDSLPGPQSTAGRRSRDWTDEEKPSVLRERSVFAALTKVLSPIVTRAQWEIIIRSSMLGVLVALLCGAICFAVPFKH